MGILIHRLAVGVELLQHYDGVEIVCTDHVSRIGMNMDCDKVVGMLRPTSLAKATWSDGGRYVVCDGGMADLRRLIDLWIKSGQLMPMAKSA